MYVGSGTAQLRNATKTLLARWDETGDGWRDVVRQDFEERRIIPMESQATATLRAMQALCDVLSRIYRECS